MRLRAAGLIAVCATLAIAFSSASARALSIKITDANPTYTVTESPCLPHQSCSVTAHLSTTPISFGSNFYFDDGFDAWNASQPADAKWTRADGGALDAILNVQTFDATSNHGGGHIGGLDIRIFLDYDGADRDEFRWSQGLNDNYLLDGSIVTPFDEMDVDANWAANGTQQPPVYPFQYPDEHFFDGPRAPYNSGFFEADAMLTKVDYQTRVLTVYGGVHYGFYLGVVDVPEPATLTLLTLGGPMLLRRRR